MDLTNLKRLKPQATGAIDFLKAFESIYMISTLKPITFESRNALKWAQTQLMRNQSSLAMIRSIDTQKSPEPEFPIPSPLCIRVFSQKQL